MSKFVDERIEILIPCITKKIESKIHANELENKKIESDIEHHVKCIGCGVEPIKGIRYKCLKCSNFNFCQNC